MTTVVYRSGVLAGDTLVVTDDAKMPEIYRKVRRLKDGSLFGFAGNLEEGEMILEHVINKTSLAALSKDSETEALHVRIGGAVWWFGGLKWVRIRAPYVALGSGRGPALAALSMKATAIEAVRAARAVDVYTGGRVQAVKLSGRLAGRR